MRAFLFTGLLQSKAINPRRKVGDEGRAAGEMVGLKTEGAGGGIGGAVVDEQSGRRVQIETGGGAPENRRIGFDQPFFPGHQDSVKPAAPQTGRASRRRFRG